MHLYDLVNPNDLEEGVEDRLINVRQSEDGHQIYNYSDKAMYTPGAWDNEAVQQCRGLIVDKGSIIVARPWKKFWNYGQKEAGELDLSAPVEVTDKLDGSLGVLFINGSMEPQIATRGSFNSDQAIHATQVFRERYLGTKWIESITYTFLFEIVYPENRVVLDYGDTDDLILLGAVRIGDGKYLGPLEAQQILEWAGPVTEVFQYRTLKEALEAHPRKNAEGLCVRFLNEDRITKLKQEDYVRLHKIVMKLSEKSVWEHMLASKPLSDLLDTLPDELIPWTQEIWCRLEDWYLYYWSGAHESFEEIVNGLPKDFTRKDFALRVKDLPIKHLLFRLLDGKEIHKEVMMMIKPIGANPYRPYSEDVA